MKQTFKRISHYFKNTEGVAATEAAFLLPLMLVMLMGAFDMGRGILINQKVIISSQVAADLIARNISVTNNDINEAIEAARLAIEPYENGGFGIDVVSVRFDENQQAVELWRETRNMLPNQTAIDSTSGIFREDEGLIIVTVSFEYIPSFSNTFMEAISMQEVAFARGRRNPTVPRT